MLLWAGAAAAHDIPSDVAVQTFVKPEGPRLWLAVRVPLRAMRDVEFPEQRGYLDIEKLAPRLPDAATIWIADFVEIREAGLRLPKPKLVAWQLSLESDRSFTSFEEAAAHIRAPHLESSANVVWNQLLFDVLYEYPIHSDRADFDIHPAFAHLAARVLTVLRFLPPGGAVRAFEFRGDPGLVPLDPSWRQAALRFVELGFHHILDGTDHLLFLACLVIPFRRIRSLVWVVTAFTLAHSVTLFASAYGAAPDVLWFPPLVETLIAISIVYMALENIVGPTTARRRWMMAFAFGLVHGFGFSFALRETLQFAGSHLLASLVAFNAGVELGQLLVLLVLVPLLEALFRWVVAERMGTIILSALVAHTGWHWMTERAAELRKYPFTWPDWNAATIAQLMRWLMWMLIAVGAVWALSRLRGRGHSPTRSSST